MTATSETKLTQSQASSTKSHAESLYLGLLVVGLPSDGVSLSLASSVLCAHTRTLTPFKSNDSGGGGRLNIKKFKTTRVACILTVRLRLPHAARRRSLCRHLLP